jgi:putative hemolysin
MVLFEISLIIALTLLNGLLACSEMAVVSSRPARLKAMADKGTKGAAAARALAAEPGRFLSTVQIGITLVGVVAGAFSGATLGARLTAQLLAWGVPEHAATLLGMGLVVGAITYTSLIFGELVPKQMALKNPEKMACKIARLMQLLATVAAPLVWLLEKSGRAVLAALGTTPDTTRRITEEEIHTIMAEAEQSGLLESGERQMMARIMRLGDRPVHSVMTVRSLLDVLDLSEPVESNLGIVAASAHSRFPVHAGDPDVMLGIISAKDLVGPTPTAPHLKGLVQEAPTIPASLDALDALNMLKKSSVHMGLVYDEYGVFVGVVTAADILEAIVGSFASATNETDEDPVVKRDDGSLLLAGWLSAEDLHSQLGWPLNTEVPYETAAGMVIHAAQKLPKVGEKISLGGWQFEVVDRDGQRLDKLLARKL